MTLIDGKWNLGGGIVPQCYPCVANRRPNGHLLPCFALRQSTDNKEATKSNKRGRKPKERGTSTAQLAADVGGVEHASPRESTDSLAVAAPEGDGGDRGTDDGAAELTVQVMPGGLHGSQALVARPRSEARQHDAGVLAMIE